MSETPPDRVELTEAEREQIEHAWIISPQDGPAGDDDPMYRAVESIVAARVQALTADHIGTPTGTHMGHTKPDPTCAACACQRLRAELAAANTRAKDADEWQARMVLAHKALEARCAELERMTVNVPADIASENADLQATLDRVTALADEWEQSMQKAESRAKDATGSHRIHYADESENYQYFAERLRAALTPEGKPQ